MRNEALPYLWSPDEVRAVLAAIDRSSSIGKRDYAMILLVARLGLRTTDLLMLDFSSIDWRARTLTVVQHKTGVPLKLPLLDDVGWAIVDYLRNGRPETASKLVFVKHRHPFDELGATGAVNCRLYRYAAMAGIEFPPGRPHSMHSFRSSLARAMVGCGTPLPAVSQVLGHTDAKTTMDYYLRLDAGALRECALDVEDVIGGGVVD
ncbi:MAG: tyrosine-type recombinase/integrase [Eggerthellaceae bacterium]|nr:tyrosine-type recombinase/integrase [Eggerthellaceae bacterium]